MNLVLAIAHPPSGFNPCPSILSSSFPMSWNHLLLRSEAGWATALRSPCTFSNFTRAAVTATCAVVVRREYDGVEEVNGDSLVFSRAALIFVSRTIGLSSLLIGTSGGEAGARLVPLIVWASLSPGRTTLCADNWRRSASASRGSAISLNAD
jgi:hypothetical protein